MFRKLIPLLAAPAVLGAQQVVADPNGARQVTLAEALQLAKDNNISNITAANSVRSANNSVRSARAALLPTLDASAGQSLRLGGGGQHVEGDRIVSGGQKWSYNTGLSTSLTLFDGGKMFSDIRARNADEDAAEASQTNTNFNVALQVKTQYNAALAANEQFAAANAQLAVAKQQLDMTVARVNAGAANIADSLNSIVQVGNAELAILTAQQSLRSANAGLTRRDLLKRTGGLAALAALTAACGGRHDCTQRDADRQRRGDEAGPRGTGDPASAGADRLRLCISQIGKDCVFPHGGSLGESRGAGSGRAVRLEQQSISVHTNREPQPPVSDLQPIPARKQH